MARLPTLMMVSDLRFEGGNTQVKFTVKWASDDPYAAMIDHIRVRFMMTNLLALGVGDADEDAAAALTEMEGWVDYMIPVPVPPGEAKSAAGVEAVPAVSLGDLQDWDSHLGTLHRLDWRSPGGFTGELDNGVADDNFHEETWMVSDPAFQQRFVRLIAQARTAD